MVSLYHLGSLTGAGAGYYGDGTNRMVAQLCCRDNCDEASEANCLGYTGCQDITDSTQCNETIGCRHNTSKQECQAVCKRNTSEICSEQKDDAS